MREESIVLSVRDISEAKSRITEWVEKVSPGILEVVEPLSIYSILDNGDKQRLFINALPLDPAYDGSINIVAVLYPDGRCEIFD